ncbi:hypothetical protein HPC49_08805 [Pyxidicoccus fallax]|uniref:Uncharacterized protein n=1 Tax=Pyxidicoccus fallax TaxID=394095 RepID=A0A848LAR8_9BACT|nr:hypothetical protein [Pyxidicoccus fallax]NPC78344.1 hypothetical protein [Pyxidicoccus fallax]
MQKAVVHAGEEHSLTVRPDGTVWAWGYGWDGQLGTGTPGNSSTPSPMRSLPCRSCWTERALGAGVLFRCPRMTPRT